MDKEILTSEEKQYKHKLYQRVYRAKQRIEQIKEQYRQEAQSLPKNMELQNVLRKYYQKKIDIVEERLSKMLMDYYSL